MNFEWLQNSTFLQALGLAILHSLWQACVIWLLYQLIVHSVRSITSTGKNAIATLLIFSSFIWFIYTFFTSFPHPEMVARAVVTPEFSVTNSVLMSYISELLQGLSSYLPYLSVSYIFLLGFLAIKLFISFRHIYSLKNNHLMAPPAEVLQFSRIAASNMNIGKTIGVWLSDKIDVPATMGFFKPIILIPVASINNLSAAQLEAIILHELSHIKRNDFLINIFISVIDTILFFNPFIVLLSKALKDERENCCDDNVIDYRYDPHSYATALLSIAQGNQSRPALALAAVSGKKQLFHRIRRITGNPLDTRQLNYGQKLIALILITVVIASVSWISPTDSSNVVVMEKVSQELKSAEPQINQSLFEQIQILKDEVVENLKPSIKEADTNPSSANNYDITGSKSPDNEHDIDEYSTTTAKENQKRAALLKARPGGIWKEFSKDLLNSAFPQGFQFNLNSNDIEKGIEAMLKNVNPKTFKNLQETHLQKEITKEQEIADKLSSARQQKTSYQYKVSNPCSDEILEEQKRNYLRIDDLLKDSLVKMYVYRHQMDNQEVNNSMVKGFTEEWPIETFETGRQIRETKAKTNSKLKDLENNLRNIERQKLSGNVKIIIRSSQNDCPKAKSRSSSNYNWSSNTADSDEHVITIEIN